MWYICCFHFSMPSTWWQTESSIYITITTHWTKCQFLWISFCFKTVCCFFFYNINITLHSDVHRNVDLPYQCTNLYLVLCDHRNLQLVRELFHPHCRYWAGGEPDRFCGGRGPEEFTGPATRSLHEGLDISIHPNPFQWRCQTLW